MASRNPEHAPHLPHSPIPDLKGAGRWIQDNWKPIGLSLAATALGLTGYFMATHDGGTQNQVKPTTPASDTFKPAEPGSEVIIPAISTETPVPPTATATSTPKPPESTPTPPKEKPSSLTADNFSEFVSTVSQEEFQKLAQAQPDAFAFPVKPVNGNLEMTYEDKLNTSSAATKGNYKATVVSGSDILIISAIDGEMTVRRDDRSNKDKITSIWITKKVSDKSSLVQYIYTGDSSSISLIGNIGPSERGNVLARVKGKAGINISSTERLDQPVVINRPDGGKTEFNGYITYLTPSIFENSGWVSQNGKAVTSQN